MKIEAAAANTPKLQRGTAARLAKPGEVPVESLLASCGWEADELAPLEPVAVEALILSYPEPPLVAETPFEAVRLEPLISPIPELLSLAEIPLATSGCRG